MDAEKFARIIVIPDERGLLLGKSFGNILRPGILYQINNILDELVISQLGKTAMRKDARHGLPPNWCNDASDIIESGKHLYTEEEWQMLIDKGIRIKGI